MSFRTIIESEGFAREKALIEPDAKRIDQVLLGVTWMLSQHPEHYQRVPGTLRLYMHPTDPFPDAPALRIWYQFDGNEVVLLSIEKSEDDESIDLHSEEAAT